MRTFFALGLDQQTTAAIDRWRTISLPPFWRPVPRENLHVTLVFLGDITESQWLALARGAEAIEVPEFNLRLDSLGYWPKQEIVYLTTTTVPDELTTLVGDLRKLAQRTGIRIEKRPFHAHVTLARRCDQPPLTPIQAPDFNIAVDSFELLQSRPVKGLVRYEVLDSWR